MKKVLKIIGIGEVLWDILPSGKKIGGAPANFAYHVFALGQNGIILSRVGNDKDGKEIINYLKKLNFETDYIQIDKTRPTGVVKVRINDANQPNYFIKKNVAWDFINWSEKFNTLLKSSDAICFGTIAQRNVISRNAIINFLKKIKKDAIKVFDINLRLGFYNKKIIEESLKLSNILKLNTDELKILIELFGINIKYSEKDICSFFLCNYNLNLVCLTKGEEGSILVSESNFLESPSYPYKIADRVGSGDAFTAAMIISYLKGFTIDEISMFSNKLASWVTSKEGAMPVYDYFIKKIMRSLVKN